MDHAIVSPSGASRWIKCTRSPRLEITLPDIAGEAAREGTLAHAIGELLIAGRLKHIADRPLKQKLTALQKNKLYSKDMLQYCNAYADFVMERYMSVLAIHPDAIIRLETQVDLSAFVPESFGTVDITIVADCYLEIIDFKYGKGVRVECMENPQMKFYALGVVKEFAYMYTADQIVMSIYQPRMDNISTYEMTAHNLWQWANEVLIPQGKLAFEGKGEFVAGDHCKFCRAKNQCRANADYRLELAKYEFKKPDLLNADEMADILTRVDGLVSWANSVKEYALKTALEGREWAGFKLVKGRGNRFIHDPEGALKRLIQVGFKKSELVTTDLIGVTELEKKLGKKDFDIYVAPYVTKPEGKPALVPESDTRPLYNDPKQDFEKIPKQ